MSMRKSVGIVLALAFASSGGTKPAASYRLPDLIVRPADGLVDQPYQVLVTGAAPGARVVIEARLSDEQSPAQTWTAVGEYRADASGVVDTARSASLGGSYEGVLAGGLACSALPVPRAQVQAYLAGLADAPWRTGPLLGNRDRFETVVTARVDDQQIGTATIERRYVAPDVAVTEVAEGSVRGLYLRPARVTGAPVVVIAGSGGGVPRGQAGLLASRGHPVLALAFFNYPGLPNALVNVPLETFADGAKWLAGRSDGRRVVLMGTSRGTEAVQLTAAYFPEHIAGVIALAPSPLVHGGFGAGGGTGQPAWTLRGQPLPFARLRNQAPAAARQAAGRAPPGHSDAPAFLAMWNDPASYALWATPLERVTVPILAIGGGRDLAWPSAVGAAKIKERMVAVGRGDLVELHVYPDAGHLFSRVGIASAISHYSLHPVSKLWSSNGGVPEANCAAGYDAWSRVLAFLQRVQADLARKAS